MSNTVKSTEEELGLQSLALKKLVDVQDSMQSQLHALQLSIQGWEVIVSKKRKQVEDLQDTVDYLEAFGDGTLDAEEDWEESDAAAWARAERRC